MGVRVSLRAMSFCGAAAVFALGLAPAAQAADCPTTGAATLAVGTVVSVAPGAARTYSVSLGAGQGIIVDLASLTPRPSPASEEGEGEGEAPAKAPRALRLCDAAGKLLAPLAGEVFEKGGSVRATEDGERLRFLAGKSGQYLITVAAADEPREVLVRRRDSGTAQAPVISAALDSVQKGITSSGAPMLYAFDAPAGQWVELKSTSEKDTVLRLAGPDRTGTYSQIAENDDAEGTNPRIRRRLPVAGTYYVQVDSLSDEPGEFEFALKRIAAPRIVPPAALRPGASVAGKLKDGDDVQLYSLPVLAGRQYRLDLTAPYDGVVAIGVANPVAADDGDETAPGFAEIRSKDENVSGTERLSFTAQSNGTLLVRVKSFGIGETDGGYSLTLTDLGG